MSGIQGRSASGSLIQHSQPGLPTETLTQGHTDRFAHAQRQKGLPKKRDTHFLCFPLVTDTSIPQLANSLKHFRAVTTKPSGDGENKGSKDKEAISEADSDEIRQSASAEIGINKSKNLEPNINNTLPVTTPNTGLEILPPITHRPPGTFHLTLGVMDLSEAEEMQRALDLLQRLDYADIFRTVQLDSVDAKSPGQYSQRSSVLTQEHVAPSHPDTPKGKTSSLIRPISPPPIHDKLIEQTEFSRTCPPQISLTGISTFPSAKSSRVFYAKPSPSSSAPFPLLRFGQAIRKIFREEGFITETRPLVLHATVANMRYATQARGGRTSKGKPWKYGKDRWRDGEVDAREIIKCFDTYEGDVDEYMKGKTPADDHGGEFIWATGIELNRVAICKMGAEKSDDAVLGMVYPPVGEKAIFS